MPTCLRVYKAAAAGLGTPPYAADDATGVRYDPLVAMRYVGPDHLPTSLVNCQYVGISGAEYLALQAGPGAQEPFDYALASGFFSMGLVGVLSAYLVAHQIGIVLRFLRSQ